MAAFKTFAVAMNGLDGHIIEVEAAVTSQLPGMVIIGLPDTALSEAKQRIRVACHNSAIKLAPRFITLNLSPAELPKNGSGFDLAMAVVAVAASGYLDHKSISRAVHIGELGLDGQVRRTRGVLPAVLAAKKSNLSTVLVPSSCLDIARELSEHYPVHLVNSVNNDRIEGQKTGAFEIVDVLGEAPDFHFIPVGNAGNYTAYHRGYTEYAKDGISNKVPRMFGFQAEGSAPLVLGHPVENPDTIATAIRIGKPASWELALAARDDSNGYFGAISDRKILEAHRILSSEVGIFVEPASAAPIAGLLERAEAGEIPAGAVVAVTVTGHGLKDPLWAAKNLDGTEVKPTVLKADTAEVAAVLGLKKDH